MPLQKNQLLTLRIERLSNDGSGVAHSSEGEAVFVPGTAPGDEAQVRIVKDCGRYAFGILDKLLTPSPDRIPVDCAVAGPCGGCSLRHLDYAAELRAKQESVADAFRRIGGLDVPVLDALPSPEVDRYRNKVQFPVGRDKDGAPCIGFYAGRTHRIVPCPDCKLQPGVLNDIGNTLCAFFAAHGIQPYDEERGKGLVRHIFLRRGAHSGQIMVCLVCTRPKLPHSDELVALLREKFRDIATILINVNAKKTNVILGEESVTLYGPGCIEDTLCGVPVRLGPLSFYQVNTLAAERLYGIAAEYAQLEPDDVLLDLYCGMGTIGLSMANHCRELIGVEIIPEAIDSAKANAARMGDAVAAKSRFFCADAGEAAARLAAEGLRPDVIMLDPPRKGCDETTLSAVVQMSPRRVVYVSCNPSTAARDAAWLGQHGYRAEKVQPVDLFPRTKHVETVVLLSKGEIDSKKVRVEFSLEDMDMSGFQKGATYEQIKAYVLEHTGLKVSSLYISQIKRKCGLDVGQNYNLSKKEDAKVPKCPPEKEAAIRDALKYFQMI
ncbi:MAG: 23S rRNA (uracil(1939)-C(5))-methyltransferase RlmD [Faecalibacterium prausnitzii]|nr:23S rRNA (uracil(1939)-C(5))-methyltransferase RlmD [Faecalibacterium prausnitzii]